jgi:hypothetical protein
VSLKATKWGGPSDETDKYKMSKNFFINNTYLVSRTHVLKKYTHIDIHFMLPVTFKVISERPVILPCECMLLAKEQSLPILNVLGLTWPA